MSLSKFKQGGVDSTSNNCVFFTPTTGTQGVCRRYPPTVVGVGLSPIVASVPAEWPVTDETDLCGEWVNEDAASWNRSFNP